MDRKTVKIDRQALEELLEAVDQHRSNHRYEHEHTVSNMIASLSQFIHFVDFETEVTVPIDSGLEPIPDYGEHMELSMFVDCVSEGGFIDSDGDGYYATETEMSSKPARPSDIRCGIIDNTWTHVMWFNK